MSFSVAMHMIRQTNTRTNESRRRICRRASWLRDIFTRKPVSSDDEYEYICIVWFAFNESVSLNAFYEFIKHVARAHCGPDEMIAFGMGQECGTEECVWTGTLHRVLWVFSHFPRGDWARVTRLCPTFVDEARRCTLCKVCCVQTLKVISMDVQYMVSIEVILE